MSVIFTLAVYWCVFWCRAGFTFSLVEDDVGSLTMRIYVMYILISKYHSFRVILAVMALVFWLMVVNRVGCSFWMS